MGTSNLKNNQGSQPGPNSNANGLNGTSFGYRYSSKPKEYSAIGEVAEFFLNPMVLLSN
jgi:hypothetical protein